MKPIISSMTGFTKLFGSIVTSTIWREDDKTRLVWITMLALSDRTGKVNASIPGLAALANINVEDCKNALKKLRAPDEYSRTKDHDGRRIEDADGGWILLNYLKYRELGQAEDRKTYLRLKQRERRSTVNICQQSSTHVNTPSTMPSASASASVSVSVSDDVLPTNLDCPEFREVWNSWKEHRRQIRKKLTPLAAERQLKQCSEWGMVRAIVAIEHSITKGWTGIFEPTGNVSHAKPNARAASTANALVANTPSRFQPIHVKADAK